MTSAHCIIETSCLVVPNYVQDHKNKAGMTSEGENRSFFAKIEWSYGHVRPEEGIQRDQEGAEKLIVEEAYIPPNTRVEIAQNKALSSAEQDPQDESPFLCPNFTHQFTKSGKKPLHYVFCFVTCNISNEHTGPGNGPNSTLIMSMLKPDRQ